MSVARRYNVTPARALAGGGLAGIGFALVGGVTRAFGTVVVPLFGAGVATLALGVVLALAPIQRFTYRQALIGATIGAGVAVEASVAGASLFYGRVPWPGVTKWLPALVVLFALVPAGFALGCGRRRRAVLTAAAGAAVATVLTVPLAQPVRTLGLGFRLVLSVIEVCALALVGVPFLVVGASLAAETNTRCPTDGSGTEREHGAD